MVHDIFGAIVLVFVLAFGLAMGYLIGYERAITQEFPYRAEHVKEPLGIGSQVWDIP